MRRVRTLEIEDDAVTAAIATVLLFAGVLSIVSVMLVAVTPIIEEYEGALERQAMEGQLIALSIEGEQLAERGLPGDQRHLQVQGLAGDFSWDHQRGGVWYTATHVPDVDFRLDDVLDHDDELRVRVNDAALTSLCLTDLRLGTDAPSWWRVPALSGTVHAVRADADASDLRAIEVTIRQTGATSQTATLAADGVVSWTLPLAGGSGEASIEAETPLTLLFVRGTAGATQVPATTPAADGSGRAWTVALPPGPVTAHLALDGAGRVGWSSAAGSGTQATDAGGDWSASWNLTSATRLDLTSDAAGRLLLVHGSQTASSGLAAGAAPWRGDDGAALSTAFTLPPAGGSVLISNPSTTLPATASVDGAFQAIPIGGSARVAWTATTAAAITSDRVVSVHWLADDAATAATWRPGSLLLETASDTAGASGQAHRIATPIHGGTAAAPTTGTPAIILQPAGDTADWAASGSLAGSGTLLRTGSDASITATSSAVGVIDGTGGAHPIRAWSVAGSEGMAIIPHEGAERCVALSGQSSGWVEVDLPWTDVGTSTEAAILNQQRLGGHPASVELRLRADTDDGAFALLGSGWAIHLPRFAYGFDSSIGGLELGMRGGFVGTNHPEFEAEVIRLPTERLGDGRSYASSLPLLVPTQASAQGGGDLDVELTLTSRRWLADEAVESVRRGWDGPYGAAIVIEASNGLSTSEDWLVTPGQPDAISDYNGWLPDPATSDASEALLLTPDGRATQFQLNIGRILVDAEVVR